MDYYIAHSNSARSGPFKENELIANGVTGNTLVWRLGMNSWQPAHQLKELSALYNNTVTLQHQIEETRKEIAELSKQVAELQVAENDIINEPPPLPEELIPEKTRYNFPSPTWIKETWIVLACVALHFLLGITGATTFYYIFFDLVGFALCFVALYIGTRIKNLNKVSYAQGTPSRELSDRLARINGWLVSSTMIVGTVIIMVQLGSDILTEGGSTLITYIIIYLMFMGVLWYLLFMPNKTDGYSFYSSPTLKANINIKNLNQKITRRNRRKGYYDPSSDDYDDYDDNDDYDSSDWDSSDDDDGDWDWGGGDSGGGGAGGEW